MKMISLKTASLGSVSHGTLRTEDLLETLGNELESQIARNGAYLSLPENFPMRDRLNALRGEAQDAFADDGETLTPEGEENGSEIVSELCDALSEFAPPYASFGSHPGDGADFGYWVDIDNVKESLADDGAFISSRSQEYPEDDYRGEWLHVSDHGNATLYVREDVPSDSVGGSLPRAVMHDREIWSIC